MNWYIKALKQYVDFRGRARRKEYWMFTLYNYAFLVLASILDYYLNLLITKPDGGVVYIVFISLYGLAVLLPTLAVTIRRIHDVGKSGWMILVTLIPVIGVVWFYELMLTNSTTDENKYGPNPKGV
jgi:uncharacterized membrane protein YhaH (DUF805 family)